MAVVALSSESKVAWDVDHRTLATTNTWETFTVPEWARIVTIVNTHPTAILRVGAQGTADALAAPGAVKNIPLVAGGALIIAVSDGRAEASLAARTIPLHSTQATHIVAFLIEAAS